MAPKKTEELDKKEKKDSPPKKVKKANTTANSTKNGNTKKDGINDLKEQLALEKDRVLRLSAEFENHKKRKQREIDDFKKFANESVFTQILTVVDNLERAIESAKENADDDKNLLEGVELTYKGILKLFETFNVKLVDAENQPFDPNFHQAVTQEETDTIDENTVTRVLQKGYTLNGRLIRPAMVVVSKKAQKETTETKEN